MLQEPSDGKWDLLLVKSVQLAASAAHICPFLLALHCLLGSLLLSKNNEIR